MTYLVDANVLCEPTKPAPNPKVIDWLDANEQDLVVDPIVLGEVHFGILALPRGRKRTQLQQWFEAVVQTIDCLPWDAATGLRWARLLADLRAAGQSMPIKDSLIAATALVHGLTIATRNTRDFKKTRVKVIDPFE